MQAVRKRIYEIIAEPPEGDRLGNFVTGAILVLIAVNVTVGVLETVDALHSRYASFFYWFEFVSVVIFTIEYLLRIWGCTSQASFSNPIGGRMKYASQPMSVIDFLAIAPFYLQFLLPSGMDLRFVRVLRLFRECSACFAWRAWLQRSTRCVMCLSARRNSFQSLLSC